MIKVTLPKNTETQKFVKRMFYIAWKESQVVGLGIMQDQGDKTEDEVFENIVREADYAAPRSDADDLYADYVFGRMMKLGVYNLDKKGFMIRDEDYNSRFNSFARNYPNTQALLQATINSLGLEQSLTKTEEKYEIA